MKYSCGIMGGPMKSIRLKSMGGVSNARLPSLNDPDENNSGGNIEYVQ